MHPIRMHEWLHDFAQAITNGCTVTPGGGMETCFEVRNGEAILMLAPTQDGPCIIDLNNNFFQRLAADSHSYSIGLEELLDGTCGPIMLHINLRLAGHNLHAYVQFITFKSADVDDSFFAPRYGGVFYPQK